MSFMRTRVRILFYAEMSGAGMYHAMADQYMDQSRTSRLLRKAGDHEARHGRLFRELYRAQYGHTLAGEGLWRLQGRVAAAALRIVPLKAKIRILSRIEALAVANLEKTLAGGDETPLNTLLREILPEEEFHAALYQKIYAPKPCAVEI